MSYLHGYISSLAINVVFAWVNFRRILTWPSHALLDTVMEVLHLDRVQHRAEQIVGLKGTVQ